MSAIETKLAELGVTLPDVGAAPKAAGNYLPFVTVGDMVYVSGQISQDANGPVKGVVGRDFTLEQGAEAAKLCAISLLTQVKVACDGVREQFWLAWAIRTPAVASASRLGVRISPP